MKQKLLGLVAEECERLFKLHPVPKFVEIDSAQLLLRAKKKSPADEPRDSRNLQMG